MKYFISLLNIAPSSFSMLFFLLSNFETVLPNRAPFMGLILIYMAAEHRQRAEEKRGKFGTMREEGGQKICGGA